jgi:serine protease inhibitor
MLADMLGAGVPVQPKKSFIVDRPFIFYIRVDGLILFQGRVIVPHK